MIVMLTSVGQRVDIARAFRAAGATTLGVDADELAPALYHCDRRVIVPRIADPDYVSTLVGLRSEHDVRLVVPLNDLDFPVLARERDRLAPALVLLPDIEASRRMSDKLEAHRFFVAQGIPSPGSWAPEDVPADVRFPVLVKAREGFGSRNILRADDPEELAFFLAYAKVPSFVQELCQGDEFSIDVFCDMDGRCLHAIPRTMLLSKGGESIKGVSIKDRELIDHGARVAELVGVKGPATVQCFREPDGSLPITDVNTRFGGGFPVPLASGGRYPELALALARGETPEPRLGDFVEGVAMTRYFSEVCLAPGEDGGRDPILPLP